LSTSELCEKLYKGHQRKDEEKYNKLDDELTSKRGLVSEAIAKATENSKHEDYHRITTPEDKEKVEEFRDQVKKEENYKDFRDLIKEDALLHPDATGLEDKR
jgi:hypothetical protein